MSWSTVPSAEHAAARPQAQATAPDTRAIGLWLLLCCAMVLAMAVIGAVTRLTESGLSIMEWAPLMGALPPLSDAEWLRLFMLYQQTPEYQEINAGMTLAGFKTIFWWEYVHRLWGRLIGLVFALPLLWFLIRRRIPAGLAPHLLTLLALGALQGALGWYMVASGFAGRTDVSQYRLVAHLSLALVIYGYLVWTALRVLAPQPIPNRDPRGRALRRALVGFLALIFLTILAGGFVAGLNAGLIYNTFPLMDGRWVPEGYGALEPFVLNAFETVAAVQFNHRVLAVLTVAAALGLWLWGSRLDLDPRTQRSLGIVALTALAQVALGIATLLLVVPIWLGALHQAGAFALATAGLFALYNLRARHDRL